MEQIIINTINGEKFGIVERANADGISRNDRYIILLEEDQVLEDGTYEFSIFKPVYIAADFVKEGEPIPIKKSVNYLGLKRNDDQGSK